MPHTPTFFWRFYHTLITKLGQFFATLSLTGLLLGFLCFYASMSPMLLPRTWIVQAVCCGVSGALGYAFGRLLMGFGQAGCLVCRHPMPFIHPKYRLWLGTAGVLGVLPMTFYQWQAMERIRQKMAMDSETLIWAFFGATLGLVLWLMLVAVMRWLMLLAQLLVNLVAPKLHLPVRALCWVGAILLVSSVALELTRHYLWQPTLQKISQTALELNMTQPKALTAPTLAQKSGSTYAVQSWDELGHYGQRFVSLGLSAKDIRALTHQDAKEPIRVFVGLNNQEPNDTLITHIVAQAMSELDRTQAWQRKYLVLHGATGRGWVDEYSSLAAEYLTDGDIASVAVQYSYLPSQVSFVLDQKASKFANQLLFNAIDKKLQSLPAATRPKLILAGESLGAFATQSNFDSEANLIDKIDGAVWVGTPRLSPLWETLVKSRLPQTHETLPIINHGRHIRFMDSPQALGDGHPQAHLYTTWQSPKIVFVQYASDPIVWWSPSVLYARPDWMNEPAGSDVANVPMWLPLVSLWELTLDMPASSTTPAGHGHIYRYDTIHAWQAILDKQTPSFDAIAQAIDERIAKFVKEREQ